MTQKPRKFFDASNLTFPCCYGVCSKRLKRHFKCWRCFLTFCQKHSSRPFGGERICINCEREQNNRAKFMEAAGVADARERAQWEAEHDPAGASQDIFGW
jgi:hypothetical protein